MDDQLKQFGVWAGIGAAVGLGIALGMGLRVLATGALIGVGAGAALGVASNMRKTGGLHHDGMLPTEEASVALH